MKKALLIVLALLLVIVLAIGGVFLYYTGKVNKNDAVGIVEAPEITPDPNAGPQTVSFATIDPASITPTPTPEPTPMPAPIYAVNPINEDIINVMLIGIDPREEDASAEDNANSDSMMLVSCNLKTKRVCLFSFMRDGAAYINNSSDWYDKINKAYSNGGIGMLINTLNGQRNYQLDIQNYVAITFTMFEDIVDAFGGVDVELTVEECEFINKKSRNEAAKAYRKATGKKATDETPLEYNTVEVYDGVQHLSGEMALWYARDRYSGGTADHGRTARQRNLIQLMYEKVRKEWTISKLLDVVNYVAEKSATNLSADAIIQLATIALSNDFTIESSTVPFPGTGHHDTNRKGKYMLNHDIVETRETLLDIIYNGAPMPDGEETMFGGGDDDEIK